MIRLVGVEKALGGQPVLRGVNLLIPKGKLTAIIGRSGEGKSVLLKHMIGLLQPDRGEVWVNGVELTSVRAKRLKDIRRRCGVLFQGAALFDSLTVWENVAFPLRETLRLAEPDVRRRVDQLLEEVALADMGYKYPAELSGGMKKRVGLARALALEPEIVLFDEPTAGLDPVTARTIRDLILASHRRLGCTTVLVSHDLQEVLTLADCVAFLADGKIAVSSPTADLARVSDPSLREFLSAGGLGGRRLQRVA